MTVNLLDYFLLTQIMAFFMIFCRVGSALMMIPGFGEVYVSPRIRLLFALVFSLLLLPLLSARIPAVPASPLALGIVILGEILIGSFIGMIARTMLSAMHVAGTVIASQSSLATAAMFDPSSGGQSPVVSNLLTIGALTLFFVLDLHHLLLAALVQSYEVFPAEIFPSVADMNLLHTRVMADAFTLGVMLSAPHIIFSLLFYLAGGLMTRLMPNFQVFFIMMPAQIFMAFFLLLAALPVMFDMYTNFMESQITDFVKVD
jgi:flagellar biosynthetic protein FliR